MQEGQDAKNIIEKHLNTVYLLRNYWLLHDVPRGQEVVTMEYYFEVACMNNRAVSLLH